MPDNADTNKSIAAADLARRILTCELGSRVDHESQLQSAEIILDKLRLQLSKQIGQDGFRTLLTRSLSLAKVEHPSLSHTNITPDGILFGLRDEPESTSAEFRSREIPPESVDGALAVVAKLLQLLATLIGDKLTLRILSTVWIDLNHDDSSSW